MLKTIFLLFISLSWQTFASPPPPPADAVFKLTISALDPNTFILDWQIKPGYFLYENRIKLIEHEGSNQVVELAPIQLPKAYKKTDSQGGTFAIYREQLILPVTVLGHSPGEVLLDVRAQGCSDGGFCYPPKTTTIKLTIDTTLALTQAMLSTPLSKPPPATTSTAKSLDINWDAVANAASYSVKIYNSAGTALLGTKSLVTGTSTTISSANYAGITDNTSYKVSVTAIGDAVAYDDSAESSQASATTNVNAVAPSISAHPSSVNRTVGQSATLSVTTVLAW